MLENIERYGFYDTGMFREHRGSWARYSDIERVASAAINEVREKRNHWDDLAAAQPGWKQHVRAADELIAILSRYFGKGEHPLDLTWGENPNREPGRVHIEWHAPCGCAYHPTPFPHVHPCSNEHKRPDLHKPEELNGN